MLYPLTLLRSQLCVSRKYWVFLEGNRRATESENEGGSRGTSHQQKRQSVGPRQITPEQLGKQDWDGAEEGPYLTRTHQHSASQGQARELLLERGHQAWAWKGLSPNSRWAPALTSTFKIFSETQPRPRARQAANMYARGNNLRSEVLWALEWRSWLSA